MDMNCIIFRDCLDQYVDSTLDEETRLAMESHASSCEDCAAALNNALRLAALCASLNDDLSVPLECQAGWRRAVREDIAARKRARAGSWRRALSVAAAVAILFCAVASQTDMAALFTVSSNDAVEFKAATSDYDALPEPEAAYDMSYGASAANDAFMLQSDGSTDDVVSVTADSGETGVVVLRSASRNVLSTDFDADATWLEDLVSEYGAYFEERRVTGQTGSDGRVLNATVRVPADSLDDFLTAMDALGTTTLREEYAEDITDEYNDVSARLTVLRSQLEQLNAMNATAQSVDDLIAINERATDVMADIESYESQLRGWDSRKNYAAVTIRMTEDTPETVETPLSLGQRMKDAFDQSVEWLRGVGQSIAVFGAALLPRLVVWGPVAVVVIVLLYLAFRKKKQ